MELIKNIYKNKEYTNYTTLFENLLINSPIDPNINYEFELRLVDSSMHTPKGYFKEFQKYEKLNLKSVTDTVVLTYEPTIPIQNLIYRSYIDIEDSMNPDFDIKSTYGFETKETLIRVTPNNFNLYPISPTIKYAIEKNVSKFKLPLNNIQRRLRATYFHTELPFKFDFTLRYLPNGKDIEENIELVKNLRLNSSDVYSPNYKNNFTMMLDLEIEYTKENMNEIQKDFYILLNEIYINSNLSKNDIEDKYKFNPVYQEISNIYNITKSPQVLVLNNSIIQTTSVDEYVWLEKTDGVRFLIIFYKHKIYSFSNSSSLVELNIKYKSEIDKLTIVDTEFYNDKEYKIFDIVMVEEESIVDLSYKDRMKKWSVIKNKIECKNIRIKEYYDLKSWKEVIDFVNNSSSNNLISPISGDRIDGVIIQKKKESYDSKEPISYKLKPKRLNTIDFKLMWNKVEERYYLYLVGRASELIYNLRYLPRYSKISNEFFGYDLKKLEQKKQYFILFDSPYANNLWYFKPREVFKINDYPDFLVKESVEIMKEMIKNPKQYHEKIVEMSLADDGWIPLRLRFDKQYPNSYRVGLSNAALLFSPVTYGQDVYFTRDKLAFDEELIDTFHKANRAIRTFIFDKFINNNQENDSYLLKDYNTCVDLAGGRGGDLLHLFNAGCNTIFAIDADKEALITYTQKAGIVQNKNINHVLSVLDKNLTTRLTFNAIYGFLSSNNTDIKKDLYSRKEFRIGEIDLVVMNYAFHYICNKYPSIIELRNDVKKMLTSDGVFILTFYDGEQILDKLGNKDEEEFSKFKIKRYTPKPDYNDIVFKDLEDGFKDYIDEKQLRQLVEVLDLTKDSLLTKEPEMIDKNKNYLVMNLDTGDYEIIFKPYYTQNDKDMLEEMVVSIFEENYENNPWALMPLPTISSSGYKEEPLVLRKYLDILTEDFEIIEELYPLQNQKLLEYFCKNKIDTYLNDYLLNIKTVLLKMK